MPRPRPSALAVHGSGGGHVLCVCAAWGNEWGVFLDKRRVLSRACGLRRGAPCRVACRPAPTVCGACLSSTAVVRTRPHSSCQTSMSKSSALDVKVRRTLLCLHCAVLMRRSVRHACGRLCSVDGAHGDRKVQHGQSHGRNAAAVTGATPSLHAARLASRWRSHARSSGPRRCCCPLWRRRCSRRPALQPALTQQAAALRVTMLRYWCAVKPAHCRPSCDHAAVSQLQALQRAAEGVQQPGVRLLLGQAEHELCGMFAVHARPSQLLPPAEVHAAIAGLSACAMLTATARRLRVACVLHARGLRDARALHACCLRDACVLPARRLRASLMLRPSLDCASLWTPSCGSARCGGCTLHCCPRNSASLSSRCACCRRRRRSQR